MRQIYIYGNSARSYLLAVVVPTEEALSRHDVESLKPLIADSLQNVAKAAGLQSYEIPRDFIVETTPFTMENGLLTGIRKLARPKLKERYGERLEQLYTELADSQTNELRALRRERRRARRCWRPSAAPRVPCWARRRRPPSRRAFHRPGRRFVVGVDVRQSAARDLRHRRAGRRDRQPGHRPAGARRLHRDPAAARRQAAYLRRGARSPTPPRCMPAISRWTSSSTTTTLAAAPTLPGPSAEVRTVLLTGATGFLGRFLALEWLEAAGAGRRQADLSGARAKTTPTARARLDNTFDSGDPEAAARITANWPPTIWRWSPATRAKPTSAWISRPGSGWPTQST